MRKLLEEKRGHVKAAFHRKDIGDIDLVWGNDQVGLCHILKRRGEQGVDLDGFAASLTDTIQNGEMAVDEGRQNFRFWKNKQEVVVSKLYFGKKIQLVVTAYPARKKPRIYRS